MLRPSRHFLFVCITVIIRVESRNKLLLVDTVLRELVLERHVIRGVQTAYLLALHVQIAGCYRCLVG